MDRVLDGVDDTPENEIARLLSDMREAYFTASTDRSDPESVDDIRDTLNVLKAALMHQDPQLATTLVFFGLFDCCQATSEEAGKPFDWARLEECLVAALEFVRFVAPAPGAGDTAATVFGAN